MGNDKSTQNHGHYFTFPLMFLWVEPDEFKSRCGLIVGWSIIRFIESGAMNGTNDQRYKQAQAALNFSGGTYKGSKDSYDVLQRIVKAGTIYTSVKTSYLFDARDGKLLPDLLLLIAAVRPIIGKRNFTKTYREVILERMYNGMPWAKLTRYSFDKLFNAASSKGMVTRIPAGRGYYVSIRWSTEQLKKRIIERVTIYQEQKKLQADSGKEIAALKRSYQNEPTKPKAKTIPELEPDY